jgi:hypothetical protein
MGLVGVTPQHHDVSSKFMLAFTFISREIVDRPCCSDKTCRVRMPIVPAYTHLHSQPVQKLANKVFRPISRTFVMI